MTNYCKSNVRRVINYTNTEPLNKYDLWLSENLRYNEDGELEYDNNGLPACDLILKIFRNGKWEPIVGYNTAAANKINIVDEVNYTYTIPNTLTSHTNNGFQQNHLPLFRNPEDSPDELFDAGTLGQALYGFVTEAEWNILFNASWFQNAFNTSIIGGNSYDWNTLINSNIDFATTTQCGGIYSATHPVVNSEFKPIEVKFYPNVPGYYQDEQHRLCVSAKDVIDLIDEYYLDNPDPNNPVPIPIGGTFENTSSIGSSLLHTNANPNALKAQIYNVNSGNAGKFLRVKPLSEWPNIPSGQDAPSGGWNQANCLVEWVDSPDTWRPIQVNGSSVIGLDDDSSGNTINLVQGKGISISTQSSLDRITPITVDINVTNALNGQVLSYNSTLQDVEWVNPQASSYTQGTGVLIDQNVIKSEVLVDNTSHTANMSIAFECAGESNNGYIKAGIDILGNSSQINILPFNYTLIESGNTAISVSFTVNDQKTYMKGDPVFVELDLRKTFSAGATASITFGENAKWVDEGNSIQISNNTGTFKDSHVLVTIQFGIVRIEAIEDYVQQP